MDFYRIKSQVLDPVGISCLAGEDVKRENAILTHIL